MTYLISGTEQPGTTASVKATPPPEVGDNSEKRLNDLSSYIVYSVNGVVYRVPCRVSCCHTLYFCPCPLLQKEAGGVKHEGTESGSGMAILPAFYWPRYYLLLLWLR